PPEVEGPVAAHSRARRAEGRVGEERPVLDSVVDAYELLVRHVAGAQGEVAHLAVAHHTVGKAHVAAARAQGRVRVRLEQRAQTRRVRWGDGIRRRIRRDAPSIEPAKDDRSVRGFGRAAQANPRTTAAYAS